VRTATSAESVVRRSVPGALDSANDFAVAVPGHHAGHGPADPVDVFQPVYVLGELPPIRPMMVAVVLQGQLDVVPAQIQNIEKYKGKPSAPRIGIWVRGFGNPASINNSRSQVSLGYCAPASTRSSAASN